MLVSAAHTTQRHRDLSGKHEMPLAACSVHSSCLPGALHRAWTRRVSVGRDPQSLYHGLPHRRDAAVSLCDRLVWLENPEIWTYVKPWSNSSYFIMTLNETVFYTVKHYSSLNFEAALCACLQRSASSKQIICDSPGGWLLGFYCFLLNSCSLL